MAAFEYRQEEEIRDALATHQVRYLFIGKSGAILLGFPDTTQDANIFVERAPENGRRLVGALRQVGFQITDSQAGDIQRGKDFIQLKDGPFDLDLVLRPTVLNGSPMRGIAASKSRDFRSATRMISSRAKQPRTGSKIVSRSRVCARFGTTGCDRSNLRLGVLLQKRVSTALARH